MKVTKQKILEFIVAYIQKHSYPPTVREIGEGVGLKSTSSVQSRIVHMLDCGMIETDAGPKSTRAIRVPGYKFVKADEWIPADEPPKDDNYVLLSFENFSLPMVGRYESDGKGGGLYYIGDCDGEDTCIANDLYVNAWMPLPKQYKPEETKKRTNADRFRSMSDEELAKEIADKIECTNCPFVNEEGKCGEVECDELFLEWLRSEVE